MKKRVAILISGGGTNLQAIIDKWQAGGMPHAEPVLVISSKREAGGLERAERAGIRNLLITKDGTIEEKQRKRKAIPEDDGTSSALFDTRDTSSDSSGVGAQLSPFEVALIDVLEAEKIDLIVLAGFLRILSAEFVARYPKRIINVHPSLIPSFCGDGYYGLKVHEAALERGVKLTGATVHFVNEITDGGEIIAQRAVEVKPDDTPESLQRRVMEEAEWILLPEAIEKIATEIEQKGKEARAKQEAQREES